MARQERISMATRKELVQAVRAHYQDATRSDKARILNEFIEVTSYHRKHAIRALGKGAESQRTCVLRRRTYDEPFRRALIVLWEAGDRVCGKRLKALILVLVDTMERHDHLQLDASIRERLLRVSAATIDRQLQEARAGAEGGRSRRHRLGDTACCAGAYLLRLA
jgi:hypothetical protein